MDINGTATISLNDLQKLRNAAERGMRTRTEHELLFRRVSQFVTSLVYDGEMPQEAMPLIIERVRMLSQALPNVNFYHDKEKAKIILRLKEEAVDG